MIEIKHKETGEVWQAINSETLRGADLRGADLRWADLRGADLRGADLFRADLFQADLFEADLREADLRVAGMSEADLRGANLFRADMRGASLRGADLFQAENIFSAGRTCDHIEFFAVNHGDGIFIKADTDWWTMAEAREFYETGFGSRHPAPILAERIAKLDAIEAGAIARGWAV